MAGKLIEWSICFGYLKTGGVNSYTAPSYLLMNKSTSGNNGNYLQLSGTMINYVCGPVCKCLIEVNRFLNGYSNLQI